MQRGRVTQRVRGIRPRSGENGTGRRLRLGLVAIVCAVATVAAACGSGGDDATPDTTGTTEAPFSDEDALTPTPTTTAPSEPAATPDEEIPISITEIDFEDGTITITNHGTADVELGDVWLCEFPKYEQLDAMVLAGGESIDLANPFDSEADDGELALYRADTFGDADAMLSYVHWGADDHTRTPVAIEAELWVGDPVEPVGSLSSGGRFAVDADGWSALSSRPPGSTAAPLTPRPTTTAAPPSGGSTTPPTTARPGATTPPPSAPPPAPTTTLPPDEY